MVALSVSHCIVLFFKTNSPPWLANKDSEVRSDLMHGDVRGGAIFFIEKS